MTDQGALAALAPPSGEGVACWLFEEMYVTQWADPAKGIEGSVAWRPGSSVEYPTTLVAQKWARNVRPCYTTPQSAPVDGDAVQQALLVINDAANDARHRGDYARANALVRARVTLYRASATPPPASQERGGDWVDISANIAESILRGPLANIAAAEHGSHDQHIVWMCMKLAAKDVGSATKCCRWLGYIQGAMVEGGWSTLPEEKERNRAAASPPSSAAEGPKECNRNCDCVGECKAGLEARK